MSKPTTSSTDLFSNVLAQLVQPREEVSAPVVDEARLLAASQSMVRHGYRMEEKQIAALKAYLEGKSLFLAGTVGTGKTLFFRKLHEAGIAPAEIVPFSLLRHASQRLEETIHELRALEDREVLIDDLGTDFNTREFGNSIDVLASLLEIRDDSPYRTHYTTNLTRADLMTRYGDRVMSRLGVCQGVVFLGKDRRTVRTDPKIAEFERKCRDPRYWRLCKERCTCYLGNCTCALGKTVPPPLADPPGSPERVCGVGTVIPYRPEYIVMLKEEKEERERKKAEKGLVVGG